MEKKMTTHPQQQNSAQDNYYPDDEIELIDLLRVLWKWKWIIILITFGCMLAAGVFSFMVPKIYEVSGIIEPGVIDVKKDGSPVYLDSTANIKAKIGSGVYNSRILKKLNIDSRKTELKFKADNPKGAKMVRIFSEWKQNEIATGKKLLVQLVTELSYDYERGVQAKKEDIDKQILLELNDIQGKKSQIKSQKAIIKNIRERENELIREIKQVKDNTERLIQQKNRVLEGKSEGDNVSLLLYFTTVQQNVAYFNQLNNQLNNLKSKEEKLRSEIEKLKKEINDINTGIERLNIKKNYIENIKLISEPEASMFPVKPKKVLNIALAGVVGFMLAVFMAFFAEYIKKSKEKSTTQHQQ